MEPTSQEQLHARVSELHRKHAAGEIAPGPELDAAISALAVEQAELNAVADDAGSPGGDVPFARILTGLRAGIDAYLSFGG